MTPEAKAKRREQILDAALTELSAKGWGKTSMSGIAKRAKASKETLYAWFGDRQGLFEALIRFNAAPVDAVSLELGQDRGIEQVLTEFGAALLHLLLSPQALALNRAAIAEAGHDAALGALLLDAGKNTSLPPFKAFLEQGKARGDLQFDDVERAANDYLGLLKADAQLQALLQNSEVPIFDILQQAEHAARQWLRLYQA